MTTSKRWLPVLDGDPEHALGVHVATSWATPLLSTKLTCAPDATVGLSGLKQYEVPPPLQVPDVIMMIAVVALAGAATAMPTAMEAATAPNRPMSAVPPTNLPDNRAVLHRAWAI
jgi:hypothetical protein